MHYAAGGMGDHGLYNQFRAGAWKLTAFQSVYLGTLACRTFKPC